jgi:predicted CopG family antitoxin
MLMKQMAEQESVAKPVRVSDETYRKLQKAQRVRESYDDVVDRAVDALLEKREGQ